MNPLFDNAAYLTKLSIEMRRTGIPIDAEKRAFHRERLQKSREAAKQKFFEAVGDSEINLNSSHQIAKLFYEKLGLPVKKAYLSKTTGQPGIPKSALRDARIECTGVLREAATHLLQFREDDKYETTYVGDGYYLEDGHYGLKVFRKDGRVHYSWNPLAAATFRSTGDGQQVPKHVYDANGNVVRLGLRDQHAAPPGYVFIEADYSQQELRKVALYAGCEPLIHELTRPGGDAHGLFTRAMFRIPDDKYDKKQHKGMRDLGKTLVFAVLIYGGKPETGWRQVAPKYPKLTVALIEEAKRAAYDKMPEIPRYHAEQTRFAKERGYTVIPNADYTIKWKFGPIDNTAIGEPENSEIINRRIQTGCAIMMNAAMVRVHRALPGDCKIVLQVHDALFVLAPEDKVNVAAKILKDNMEQTESYLARKMLYPVDIKVGTRWGELEDWKP